MRRLPQRVQNKDPTTLDLALCLVTNPIRITHVRQRTDPKAHAHIRSSQAVGKVHSVFHRQRNDLDAAARGDFKGGIGVKGVPLEGGDVAAAGGVFGVDHVGEHCRDRGVGFGGRVDWDVVLGGCKCAS